MTQFRLLLFFSLMMLAILKISCVAKKNLDHGALVSKLRGDTSTAINTEIVITKKTYLLNVVSSFQRGEVEKFVGTIHGHENSTFNFVEDEKGLSGFVLFEEERKAYQLQTKGNEIIFNEVSIDEFICEDYPSE